VQDLLVVRELIAKMTGYDIPEDLNKD